MSESIDNIESLEPSGYEEINFCVSHDLVSLHNVKVNCAHLHNLAN